MADTHTWTVQILGYANMVIDLVNSVFNTGPYPPGGSVALGQLYIKNVGEAACEGAYRICEWPGTPDEMDISGLITTNIIQPGATEGPYPMSGGTVPPYDPNGWPLGVKVWAYLDESEPGFPPQASMQWVAKLGIDKIIS